MTRPSVRSGARRLAMMDMMHSTTAVVMLMVVLIVALVGILVAVRIVGGRSFNEDHDG